MKKNMITLLLATMVLLIVPLFFSLTQWQWQPEIASSSLKMLFFITQTAGNPWSALTSIVLALLFCHCLRLPLEKNLKLLAILVAMVVSLILFKSVLKEISQEPRPFVVWLTQLFHLTPTDFYGLTKPERITWLAQHAHAIPVIPEWQLHYWQTEVSYSFPSGHTLFSASWALLAGLLLWRRQCYKTCLAIFIWQLLVSISRLMLGMHWARDIIASIFFAMIIACVTCWCIEKFILSKSHSTKIN